MQRPEINKILLLTYFPCFEEIRLMRSSSCQHLKAGIVEPEETDVARQRLNKHFPTETSTHATIKELLGTVFSMQFVSYQIINM
jgi:hypothetical protein